MGTELQRCEERKSEAELSLRHSLLDLLNSQRDSTSVRADRFMQRLDTYIDAKMDLREAEAADRAAASRDY